MINGKKIGIVILNYNDSNTVKEYYGLIQNYHSLDHIMIVDNQSPDGSFNELRALAKGNVDVIQSDENKGYSYGNNFGAYHLINKYNVDVLFISNPDVEYPESLLQRIIDDMERYHAQAATGYMVQPHPYEAKMNRKINSYWREVLECTFFLKRIFPFKGNYVCPGQGILEVEWLPGSFFAIDAEVYKELGGLDDRVFLYYEEQILGKKFLNHGYKMIVDTDVEYHHNLSVSINKSMKMVTQLKQLYKSKYYFYTQYEHIGIVKRLLMKVAIHYGILKQIIKEEIEG